MAVDRLGDPVQALTAGADGADHRGLPALAGLGQMHQLAQLLVHPLGAGKVRLVDDEDVGDLQDPGLDDLDAVAGRRGGDHHGGVGREHHLELGLSDTDRLDQAPVAAAGVDQPDRLPARAGQPAEMPSRRHAADEHAAVEGVPLHPYPVAEDGAPAERAARIHGDDPHSLAPPPPPLDEPVGDGALPRPGRPGHPDDVSVPDPLPHRPDQLGQSRIAILDHADRPRQRPQVPGEKPFGQLHRSECNRAVAGALSRDAFRSGQ